jgi:hypothetical protein
MRRDASNDEEVREIIDHVSRFQLPVYPACQALPCELVDDVQHAAVFRVMCMVFDKVIIPKIARILRLRPNAGIIVKP